MDSKLVLLVLAAFVCAATARSTPDAVGTLLGNEHKEVPDVAPPKQQPVDGEDDESAESEVEDESPETEEESEEEEEGSGEEGSGEEVIEANNCDDVAGVYRSTVSEARMVLVKAKHNEVGGMFQNSTESAWIHFTGVSGPDGQFGLVAMRNELMGVTAVTGLCKPCDGSLDLSLISSFPQPGCESVVIPMPGYNYLRVGSAKDARKFVDAYNTVEEAEIEDAGEE